MTVLTVSCISYAGDKLGQFFLVEFVPEDISDELSKRQFGGKKVVGTEPLIVSLVDRIKKLLDNPQNY